uniref:Uncharacterized protein n=1 Tax=Anguilla anguilla TaxID=7936 RepID=A0A0E9WC82_ANGAN
MLACHAFKIALCHLAISLSGRYRHRSFSCCHIVSFFFLLIFLAVNGMCC